MRYVNIIFACLLILLSAGAAESLAGQANDLYQKPIASLMQMETELKADVGSRSGARDMLNAEIPIDVVTAQQIERTGFTELSKVLQRFIPGFNFPRPSITDGTDHARPFTLRGLNPDQVLVLINGKRLHTSALMNVNGSIGRGSSAVDLNTIPLRSIERIEVLRDGAAAQYGSDAIAGVINIILRGYGQKNILTTTYGATTEGDGVVRQTDVFLSKTLAYDGFMNVTMEYRDRDETNRAGVDSRDQYPAGDPRNNQPDGVNTHYGDSEETDKLLSLYSEIPTENGLTYYAQGLLDKRNGSAGAFFRRPTDSRNNINIYPDGFLPEISPEIIDYSFSLGMMNTTHNQWTWDTSYTQGYNDYHFYVNNSHNDSLGDNSPTSFDSGALNFETYMLNLDLSKKMGQLHFASGAEVRREVYSISAGDEASYILGSFSNNAGAQGFPGFQPSNEVNESRDNLAAYLDLKYDVTTNLSVEGAGRFENYSDFGSTLDGKLALSYRIQDLLLRTSGSTGFRAPSLSQSYYTSTATGRSGEVLYQTGTFRVDHPVSVALGATELKPEESQHFTGGFVYQPSSSFSGSLDYFHTKIDDRIMLSGNIKETVSPAVKAILAANGVGRARYFTNAISTETNGVDLRINFKHKFNNQSNIKLSAAYNYSATEVTKVNDTPSILGADGRDIIVSDLEITTIERGQPRDSIKLLIQYDIGPTSWVLNLNRFGEYQSVYGDTLYTFDAKWTTDLEASYSINDHLNIAIGGHNIFDVYPDKWGDTGSQITSEDAVIQYSQYSPFGYNGAFYYGRLEFRF